MKRFALSLVMALALAACDQAQTTAPAVEIGNPLLNLNREQFKTVLGTCGESLYAGTTADEATRIRCYGEIRTQLKAASQPNVNDAQLASPLISERWKFEKTKEQ